MSKIKFSPSKISSNIKNNADFRDQKIACSHWILASILYKFKQEHVTIKHAKNIIYCLHQKKNHEKSFTQKTATFH